MLFIYSPQCYHTFLYSWQEENLMGNRWEYIDIEIASLQISQSDLNVGEFSSKCPKETV